MAASSLKLCSSLDSSLKGIIAVHKPVGLTSSDVVNKIRTTLERSLKRTHDVSQSPPSESPPAKARQRGRRIKVGHGGTLDKSAEGVLVIGIGDDCKKLHHYLHGDKTYVAMATLGQSTDTCDREGTVTKEKPYDHVTREKLEEVLETFKGEQEQTPPLFSALKFDGKRASDLAREGKTVDMSEKKRTVTISDIKLLSFASPDFKISVSCSSGTYVRSLVRDIGNKLETVAVLSGLTRTQQGIFAVSEALPQDRWTADDIAAACYSFAESKKSKEVTCGQERSSSSH